MHEERETRVREDEGGRMRLRELGRVGRLKGRGE